MAKNSMTNDTYDAREASLLNSAVHIELPRIGMSRISPRKGCFVPTFIEAHQVSNMICKSRSLKSRIKTSLYSDEILTSSDEVFKDWESDLAVGI